MQKYLNNLDPVIKIILLKFINNTHLKMFILLSCMTTDGGISKIHRALIPIVVF